MLNDRVPVTQHESSSAIFDISSLSPVPRRLFPESHSV